MRLRDLIETSGSQLSAAVKRTISPTMIMPELVNSDTYKQYRYTLALAAARAHAAGEIEFDAESSWNESLAAVAYTPEELETIEMSNELMGVHGVMLSSTPSFETDDTQTASPVMSFKMWESVESIREII